MTDDIAKINTELKRLSRRLAVASNEYRKACREAAAEATITCEPEMRNARIDEAMRDATKERLRALESVLNATQTRASFLKAEMKLAGRDY